MTYTLEFELELSYLTNLNRKWVSLKVYTFCNTFLSQINSIVKPLLPDTECS